MDEIDRRIDEKQRQLAEVLEPSFAAAALVVQASNDKIWRASASSASGAAPPFAMS
jgi:hypothetical protein